MLGAAAIVWTSFVAAWSGGSSAAFVALVLASGAALVTGRLASSVSPLLVTAVVVGAAAVMAATTPDLLRGVALGGPLGYANANGAFFVQAAIAGLMLAAASPGTGAKLIGLTAAVVFGVLTFAVESLTSAALVIALPIVALSVGAVYGARAAVTVVAILFLFVLVITILLGSTYAGGDRSGPLDRVVDSTLTQRRAALWHEALAMMGDHPVAGVGMGGFQALSPTAQLDRDARWAHNSFLQHGGEAGLLGLLLLVLLFLWGFALLRATAARSTLSIFGAVALAALGIHASVDYVMHFPAVPITAAALVGASFRPTGDAR
jgi:O-antigen ligase